MSVVGQSSPWVGPLSTRERGCGEVYPLYCMLFMLQPTFLLKKEEKLIKEVKSNTIQIK